MNRNARAHGIGILDRIVATKHAEVAALAPRRATLLRAAEAATAARPFAAAVRQPATVSVIAEFKRRSPSAGPLDGRGRRPEDAARVYTNHGAAALSVLTDAMYFGGSLDDLRAAREACNIPVLRKDFVVDPLQIFEARAAGADAVLLIVRILDDARLFELISLATSLGIAALVEVHDATELERALGAGSALIGINNRDLDSFRTDLDVSVSLAHRVPRDVVLVAESGIRSASDIHRLGEAGVDAVLVGETLMRASDSGALLRELTGRQRCVRS
jgi:indole-3-glycerol phosphate synthase